MLVLLPPSEAELSGIDGVARVAERGGLRVEQAGEHALDVVVAG
ncbi:MAG: hypothetical protein ACRDTE_29045 [Pseudonocardiaceae bacterium]